MTIKACGLRSVRFTSIWHIRDWSKSAEKTLGQCVCVHVFIKKYLKLIRSSPAVYSLEH